MAERAPERPKCRGAMEPPVTTFRCARCGFLESYAVG